MFSKILIANRGEIAIRIIRACKEMGIATVAIYSQSDKDAIHTALADECICIGPSPASESYLNQNNIIQAALMTKSEAIHPGYGFLSENAGFAEKCRKYNIAFIGPSAEAISALGDKDIARRMMKKAGVPTVPGSGILDSVEAAECEAENIGYPLLVKARAGGGGKGIRLVNKSDELKNAFLTASAEAGNAFGDGGVYLEKFLTKVKHIEVQLLCDESGNTVALGERECSIQKNNQKLIEEAPSSAIDASLRAKMQSAAVAAARAAGYTNAGTVEFLLDKDNNFYFMEMNTRLQVEHPITEMITGIDLVKWQIRIAAGVPLSFTQDDITLNGASVECRINALSGGTVDFLHIPGGPWVRFDTYLCQGYDVPPFYDSMIGKLIVHAITRTEAIRKMQSALCELVISGVLNNIDNQLKILSDPDFRSGNYTTDFIAEKGI